MRGEIAQALIGAAWPPAPVRVVCERANVGLRVGRPTASRLLQAGELVVLGHMPATAGRAGRPPALVASRHALVATGGNSAQRPGQEPAQQPVQPHGLRALMAVWDLGSRAAMTEHDGCRGAAQADVVADLRSFADF